jgi:hypothetical protein
MTREKYVVRLLVGLPPRLEYWMLPGKLYGFGEDWLERPYRGRNAQTSEVGICRCMGRSLLYTVHLLWVCIIWILPL